MSRVKLTNKKTGLTIEGEFLRKYPDPNGVELISVRIDGTTCSNSFAVSDWEVSYQVELPTKLGAVIRAEYEGEPGLYFLLREGVWFSEHFEVWASDEDPNFVVTEVLFEGVDS